VQQSRDCVFAVHGDHRQISHIHPLRPALVLDVKRSLLILRIRISAG
jgi:hypothetical protein